MNFLITGATGFIGKNLARYLSEKNYNVKVLFRNREKRNLLDFIPEKNFIIKDLLEINENDLNGIDVVVHLAGTTDNYNQQDSYKIELDSFMGPDGYITNSDTTNVIEPLQALLNTKQSLQEINSIYKWLTDVNAYIWRLNSEASRTTETVVGINTDSDRAWFNCDRHIDNPNASLGVSVARLK